MNIRLISRDTENPMDIIMKLDMFLIVSICSIKKNKMFTVVCKESIQNKFIHMQNKLLDLNSQKNVTQHVRLLFSSISLRAPT